MKASCRNVLPLGAVQPEEHQESHCMCKYFQFINMIGYLACYHPVSVFHN